MNKFVTLFFTIILFSLSSAYCHAASCMGWVPEGASFSIGSVDVPAGTPVKTKIKEVVYNFSSAYANCQSNTVYSRYSKGQSTGLKINNTDIYSTNIPGIGYAICYDSSCANPTTWTYFVSQQTMTNSGRSFLIGVFQLYVTGPVSSGKLESGTYGETGTTQKGNLITFSVTGGDIKGIDCNLSNNSAEVSFGSMPQNQFTGVGSTSESKNFDIGLTCTGKANISVTLEATQNAETSDNSVIALTNSGESTTASGLGAQILYNNTPLKLNQVLPLKTTDGNTLETFTFAARYMQTKSEVTPGDANATATLSITYQ